MAQSNPEQHLREAIARVAAQDLDQVIDEARAEARERVRPVIADALADEMLRLAQARMSGSEPARPQPARSELPTPASPTPEPATHAPATHESAKHEPAVAPDEGETTLELPGSTSGLYVFGVLPADTTLPLNVEGLEPHTKVLLIQDSNLAAAASEIALKDFDGDRLRENLNDMQWLERTARAHERVLETIGRHGTLVPMRLCTVYRSQEGVLEMLAREAPALENALNRLRGKAEWGVKVFAGAVSEPAAAPTQAANGSGADYMRQRQSDREERKNAAQRQHDTCLSIHDRLSAAAAEAMTQPPQRTEMTGHAGDMVLNGVYLVENESREDFLALVEALQAEYRDAGLELEPTGPWPAYNFVPSEIGAAA